MDFLREHGIQLAIVATLSVAWFLLRTTATRFASPAAIDDLGSAGQPVVMEFFSNA